MDTRIILFKDLFVWLAAIGIALYLFFTFGFVGGNKAAKKAVEDKKAQQALFRKRKFMSNVLGFLEDFVYRVGGAPPHSKLVKLDFYITRLEIRVPWLLRAWKPIEIVGLHRFLGFVGIILTIIGISFMTINPLWFFCIMVFIGPMREMFWELKLGEEDKELEEDFPDLYLLLCPKLKMGANARIAPVLNEYLQSMDKLHSDTEHLAVKKFVRLLRANIELFPDEVLALTNIRNYYKTACIINFCNVAIQAMNGIDNKEKLVAFEQELTRRKMDAMRRRAQKLVEKAQKATYLMYIILAEFVILTLATRLGGNIDTIFNLM